MPEEGSFIDQLLTPGSIPNVIIHIVNVSVVGLIAILTFLLFYDFADLALWWDNRGERGTLLKEPKALDTSLHMHLYVIIFLSSGLLILVNWLLFELKNAKPGAGGQGAGDDSGDGKMLKTD